jgi:hypothetical protein
LAVEAQAADTTIRLEAPQASEDLHSHSWAVEAAATTNSTATNMDLRAVLVGLVGLLANFWAEAVTATSNILATITTTMDHREVLAAS